MKLIFRAGVVIGGILGVAASASAVDGTKVYYKDGTRIEFPDADIRFNIQLQPRYTFSDNDSKNRVSQGLNPLDDVSSFTVRRARLVVSGNVLDKQFSYYLQPAFAASRGGGDLRDAWIQWNSDELKVRFGQMKVPFSRQELVSSTRLFFTERSLANNEYNGGREFGAYVHGALGQANIMAGIYNGSSDGEGRNRPGVDNKHNGCATLNFSSENFGSRGTEGDFRSDDSLGFTLGASLLYGQGGGDPIGAGAGDFDQVGLTGDLGVRVAGLEVGGEYYWRQIDMDDISGRAGEDKSSGFHVQLMYVLDDLGFGGRFAYLDPDSALGAFKDRQEYTAVVNYFLNGHALKLQNAVTFDVTNNRSGKDFRDFRYELQLAALF